MQEPKHNRRDVESFLTPELLVAAYAQGIFPMGIDDEIHWFSPDPRAIIPLDTFHASKTLMQTYRSERFETRINTAFEEIIHRCSVRHGETWITEPILQAYTQLHAIGLAHSVETWQAGRLVGGLYGVSLRGAFFGESMYFDKRDASKIAMVTLVDRMKERGMTLLDVQFTTDHLLRFGAIEIPREEYLHRLRAAIDAPCTFA